VGKVSCRSSGRPGVSVGSESRIACMPLTGMPKRAARHLRYPTSVPQHLESTQTWRRDGDMQHPQRARFGLEWLYPSLGSHVSDRNQYLAQNAAAVLVFPQTTKAGIGLSGAHGDGALQENGKTVGYYSISGASIGLTFGVSRHSEVILFQTRKLVTSSSTGATGSWARMHYTPARERSNSPAWRFTVGSYADCIPHQRFPAPFA
jgi:hypothetical protein